MLKRFVCLLRAAGFLRWFLRSQQVLFTHQTQNARTSRHTQTLARRKNSATKLTNKPKKGDRSVGLSTRRSTARMRKLCAVRCCFGFSCCLLFICPETKTAATLDDTPTRQTHGDDTTPTTRRTDEHSKRARLTSTPSNTVERSVDIALGAAD